jgi:IS5 family transposase
MSAVAVLLGLHFTTVLYGYRRWQATGEVPARRRVVPNPPSKAARVRARMRSSLQQPELAAAYRRRAPLAEGGMASIKDRFGFRRVSRRGLEAVNSELHLVAIVHNVRKLQTTD